MRAVWRNENAVPALPFPNKGFAIAIHLSAVLSKACMLNLVDHSTPGPSARTPKNPSCITRRFFLAGCLGVPLLTPLQSAVASTYLDPDFWSRPRELWLQRLETAEGMRVCYWAEGQYRPEAYTQLCWLLRDVRAGQAVQMDTTLLNVLAGLYAYYRAYGRSGPVFVSSGYRTQSTNRLLSAEGAARNSMHLYGRAADITIPGVPLEHLARVKRYLHAGGLGFYPGRHFIHIDTGSTRSWQG
jgi:uncharacterized protein YcbK (DUF882 family)